jgi:hypothetical protein
MFNVKILLAVNTQADGFAPFWYISVIDCIIAAVSARCRATHELARIKISGTMRKLAESGSMAKEGQML